MLNSIFMLSKYLKKSVTTALILGLMISPILPATQSISSSISIASQAAEIEVQLEEAQASTGEWSEYANTAWYYANPDASEYTITRAEELAGLAKLVNDGTCNFAYKTIKLGDNINLGDHYWVPIGLDYTKPFRGSFDGQDYTISNMHIGTSEAPSDYQYAGLFGVVRANREATNVTIANVNIDENSWVYTSTTDNNVYAGGICAYAYADAAPEDNVKATLTIINCSNSAGISSSTNSSHPKADAGGICAHAGSINRSSASVTVINCSNSGTIAASASNKNSFNAAANAGGICGTGQSSTIINCSNSAESSAYSRKDLRVGGICGSNRGSTVVSNCYYKEGAAARGIDMEGDKLGKTTALPEDQMTAATGTMDEDWVDITIDGNSKGKMALVDALNTWVKAYNDTNPSVEALEWKVTTGNYPTLPIVDSVISTILPENQSISSNIDIAAQATEDETQVEETPAVTGYWNDYTDTAWYYNNPDASEYIIATAEELAGLAKLVNDGTDTFEGKTILLGADIDLGDHEWVPIGISNGFEGTFDGQGCKIKNMKIGEENNPTELEYVGLFGQISGAVIHDLTIDESCCIYSASNVTAAICAEAFGSMIYECNNYGNIFLVRNPDNLKSLNNIYSAGIVAKIDDSTIYLCNNKGEINSEKIDISKATRKLLFTINLGGINAFCLNSVITNCNNDGNINGKYNKENIDNSGNIFIAGICASIDMSSEISLICDCKNSGKIESPSLSAGICAMQYSIDTKIYGCTNDGNISGEIAGGIVGQQSNETQNHVTPNCEIERCINKGEVSGTDIAGGIIALDQGKKLTVDNCFNSGKIHGGTASGGIVGYISFVDYDVYEANLTSCINEGTISSNKTAGGIIGLNISRINTIVTLEKCYSAGETSIEAGETSEEAGKEGELIGYILKDSEMKCDSRIPEDYSRTEMTECGYFSDRITAIGGADDPEGVEKLESKEVVDQKIKDLELTNDDGKTDNKSTDGWIGTAKNPNIIYFENGILAQEHVCPYTTKDPTNGEEKTVYFYVDNRGRQSVEYNGWVNINDEPHLCAQGLLVDGWTSIGGECYYFTKGKMEKDKWLTVKKYEDGSILAYAVGDDGRKMDNLYAIVFNDEEQTNQIYDTEKRTCLIYQNGKLVKVESFDDESVDDE